MKPPTPLNPSQQQIAQHIYARGIAAGLPPQRARELVQAAFSESGLNPTRDNPSSGAAGLFQLLSPGYVKTANAHGGVHNPDANIGAILPNYKRYWQQHPNARPGEGGAAVEASGEGAGFYSPSLDLSFLGGGGGGAPAAGDSSGMGGGIDPAARAHFAMTIINNIGHHGPPDFQALTEAVKGLNASPAVPADGGPAQNLDAGVIVKGAYAFPVAGPSNFSNDWGAARPDIPGGHHQGTDVFAPRGTPVVAIEDGVVTKMGPSAIGGNRVWINGKWYYAHLDGFAKGIQPGARVHRGQVIGFVGDTGDAKGTPTHLHLGYSPDGSQGGSWANSYPVLKGLRGK